MIKRLLLIMLLFATLPATVLAGWEDKTMVFQGVTREYRVYTPTNYSASGSYSLVVGIHGLGDNMTNFSNAFTDFKQIADTAGIVMVFPQGKISTLLVLGTTTGWNAGAGTLGQFPSESYDDVGFINALTDSMQMNYSIIKEQTYLFGFSNGGFMMNRIACEAGDKFAAFSSLAGTIGTKVTSCNPPRDIPILHFHGTADVNVGYYSNAFGINVDSLMSLWSSVNGCDLIPDSLNIPDTKADGYTVVHYTYKNCGAPVEYFKINDAAHILLNRTNNDISYSDEMWKFFRPKKLALGLKQSKEFESVKLYPVPASDEVILDLQAIENHEILEISIFDFTGKQISIPFNNESGLYHFDCSNISNGVYILKGTNGEQTFSNRFTVVH